MMKLLIMNDDAIIPTRASKISAGLNLYSSINIQKKKYWNTRVSSRKFLWVYYG